MDGREFLEGRESLAGRESMEGRESLVGPETATPAEVRFGPDGLVPVAVQDATSGEVLMLAYASAESLARTLEHGKAWYFSRSRERLWCKGETSGNVQEVVEVRCDCDGDALLYRVNPTGPSCHTGQRSCFYRALSRLPAGGAENEPAPADRCSHAPILAQGHGGQGATGDAERDASILAELFAVLQQRRRERPAGSYSAELFSRGHQHIARKVGEEAVEVVVAALTGDRAQQVAEVADLFYHVLVLLAGCGIDLAEIWAELERRRRR